MSASASPPHSGSLPLDPTAGVRERAVGWIRGVDRSELHPALWPALALLGLYAAFYLQFAIRLIGFPFDLDQGEGYDAWSGWIVHLGQLPYTTNAIYPYYSSNYPPVWSYLVSIPMAWTGPGVAPARAVSTLAGVLCAVVIAVAARRTAGSWWAGVLGGGLFLASPYVFHTTPLARVNGTALLFGLLALLLAEPAGTDRSQLQARVSPTVRASKPRAVRRVLSGRWRVGAASLAMLLALFTKQTTLDALVAMCAYLLVVNRRRGIDATAMVAGGGLVALGALLAATRGAFWLNVVAGNANPFDVGQLVFYVGSFTLLHVAILGLAVVELLVHLRQRRVSPWILYFPSAMLMALTVGKWGAGESYFLGAIAGACVLAGAGTWRVVNAAGSPPAPYAHEALDRLRAEGAPLTADGTRVALRRAVWWPDD